MDTGSNQGTRIRLVTKEQASFTELLDHREAIILDLENLHYYALNAAAGFLWKRLRSGAPPTAAELGAGLAAAFQINAEQAELDTRAFIDELQGCGLVSPAPAEVGEVAQDAPAPAVSGLPPYDPPQLKLSNSLLHMTLSGSSTISGAAFGGGS